jgi:UDP-2-acetamido-3-amino-2,3-dideoxy-glucuronate N-acetyltransferase
MSEFRTESRLPNVRIHKSAYVDDPVTISQGTTIWHFCHVLAGATIGENCSLGQNVMVGRNVRIGSGCKIQNNVSIYEGVTLEEFVFCGPSCVFTNVINPRAEISRKAEYKATLVKRGATLGANATIICGSTIGSYALIAAGAVVTKDVADFGLVVGVPGRRVGWVSRVGKRLDRTLICPETGRRHRLTEAGELEEIDEFE